MPVLLSQEPHFETKLLVHLLILLFAFIRAYLFSAVDSWSRKRVTVYRSIKLERCHGKSRNPVGSLPCEKPFNSTARRVHRSIGLEAEHSWNASLRQTS